MDNATTPAHFMVQVKAKDFEETMECYGQFALATVAEFGGELLAGSPTPQVLEGQWDGNRAPVLRFPSLAMAEAWYGSSDYRPLKDRRINELTESNRVLLVEGVNAARGP